MTRPYWIIALLAAPPALASELSYTFVDLAARGVEADTRGATQSTIGQTVTLDRGQGDGLGVMGQLGIGERLYVNGQFESAVVDVGAVVTSPLATETADGNFDLIATRIAVGYVREFREDADLFAELGYEGMEYDFGSFAGENFDVDDSGTMLRVGARWNPLPALEVFGAARYSSVGEATLAERRLDAGTSLSLGLRWYFFEDLGLGVDYEAGHIDALSLSLRFGFGELRVGGN